jgi:hypothetical protein
LIAWTVSFFAMSALLTLPEIDRRDSYNRKNKIGTSMLGGSVGIKKQLTAKDQR